MVKDVIVINGILLIEKLNEKYYFNFYLFFSYWDNYIYFNANEE